MPLIGDSARAIGPAPATWPASAAPVRDGRRAARARLTPRQLDVLALMCEGLSNKLICERLNIARGTVRVHIGHILRELGVSSSLQAVVSAFRFGLVRAPCGAHGRRDREPLERALRPRSYGIQHNGDGGK